MKTLKITYKNGNEITMKGIYDFDIEDGKLYLSKNLFMVLELQVFQ